MSGYKCSLVLQYLFLCFLVCLAVAKTIYGEDAVDTCLKQIDSAFRWKQPAIISVHRVNFIGRIIENNGDLGVYMLGELISKILNNWPDVKFMTSDQLANEYREKYEGWSQNESR